MPGDLILRFHYPPENEMQGKDMRTVIIKHVSVVEGQETEYELYKFSHPVIQGLRTGSTTFQRKNTTTGLWMPAGTMDWYSESSVNVSFGGVERVHISDLRKRKKATSKSRRFKAGGSEYKWKIAENGQDMTCISQQLTNYGKNVAEWSQSTLTLRVAERAEPILDRIVVTLYLNLWTRSRGDW